MAPTSFPRPIGAPAPRRPTTPPVHEHLIGEAPRPTVAARRYEVLYKNGYGDIADFTHTAPALPAFEAACGAFSHGTLIQTPSGATAIEDLLPGDSVSTRDDGAVEIRWIGCMTIIPASQDPRVTPSTLTRITENSIGLGKPSRDLVLGPYARLLRRNPVCMSLFGTDSAFAPASAFTDGVTMIEINPVSPVRVYHLMLDGQHVINAAGVEVESYHPGRRDAVNLPIAMLPTFFELFPGVEDFPDFGNMRVPRLSAEDIRALESA